MLNILMLKLMIIAGRYNNSTQTLEKDTSEFWAE